LKDEAVRWAQAIKRLEGVLVNLVGNTVLGAGYISYVGTFTQNYRQAILKSWMSCLRQ